MTLLSQKTREDEEKKLFNLNNIFQNLKQKKHRHIIIEKINLIRERDNQRGKKDREDREDQNENFKNQKNSKKNDKGDRENRDNQQREKNRDKKNKSRNHSSERQQYNTACYECDEEKYK